MAKRLLAMLLCLAMVFALLPTFAVAEPEHPHGSQGYTAHSSKNSLPTDSGFYYLTEDVELPADFVKWGQSYSGKTVTICLNGHTLSRKGDGRIFNITGTSNLTICDCTGNGVITGGNISDGSGGVANIVTGGQLTISDVEISGNQGTTGGALSTQSTLTLTDVVLTNNTNTAAGGSAVYAASGANVTLTNCTITGNNSKPTSANYNGAVYVTNSGATLKVVGSTVIKDNTICNGTVPGDLLLQDAGSKLYVGALTSDAEIYVATEVKKFGTANAASDFLALADGTDKAALESAWTKTLITYTNSDQKVVYTEENGFVFGKITAPEEGHANTEGYTKCDHGTVSWTGVSTMAEINQAESGHYYLKNDIDMGTVRLTVKNDVVICLNGHTLDRQATAGGYARAIHINAGAKLTICDCTAHVEEGVYTAGTITGGWAVQGSGAYVSGTLEMYDGIFTGNKTEDYNGTKAQGTIAVLKDGAFHMYGGEISGNTSTGDGGGVQLLNAAAEFTMTGGSIRNNTADGLGGGVYLAGTGATIGGDAVITGNTAGDKASNVYLPAGTTFKTKDLTDKAAIGFLMETEPGTVVSAGAKSGDSAYFTNDNTASTYTMLQKGSRLVLDIPRTGASHPVPGYDKCGHEDTAITWQTWGDDDSELSALPAASGHYYLSDDIILPATTVVPAGQTVVLCLNGYSVSGGCALLQVDEGADYTICDCMETGTMTGNPAVIVHGDFTLADGSITGCSTTGNATKAGAVQVEQGSFTMTGGYITGNLIRGVYVATGTFALQGGEISDNISETNGGGVRINGGSMEMTGGTITANETTGNAGGCAIAIQSGSAEITGGSICGNKGNSGGTIYSVGTLTMTGVTMEENATNSNGAALYIQSGTAVLTDVILKGNQTASMGGGLFVAGGEVTVTGGKITGNSAVIGGGVRINAGTVEFKDVQFAENTATGDNANGGAISIKGGTVTITGGTFTGNQSRTGGAIYSEGELTVTDAIFTDNTSQVNGGAVYTGGGKATLTNVELKNNKSTESMGGGLCVADGDVTVEGGKITENSAVIGGGIRVNKGTVALNNVQLTNNKTSNEDISGGGAINLKGGAMTITGCTMTGNWSRTGGAICSAGELTVTNTVFTDNTSRVNGGAVYTGGGKATLTNVELKNNQSTESMGGGLCVAAGDVTVEGGKITDNSAVIGGGVRVNKGTVALKNVQITGNTAVGSAASGGGMSIKGGTVSVSDSTITGNSTQSKGGGICLDAPEGALTLSNVTITGNTAGTEGGGVFSVNAKADMILGGKTVIADNTVDGKPQNLYLGHQHNVILDSKNDPLTKGAKIGVHVALREEGRLVAVGADQKDILSYFVSDQEQRFELREDELWLVIDTDVTHTPHASDECGHKDAHWSMLLDVKDITKGSNHLYLISDLELDTTVNLDFEGEVTICLNGFDIIRKGEGEYNRLFRVAGGKLNICDCRGGGHLTGGTATQGSAIFINGADAHVNLYNGIISGNVSKDTSVESLGTVCLIQGTFDMYGGEISDNTSVRGAAVSVFKDGAVFTLHDGKICNNKSVGTGDTDGGAIHQLGGETRLLGGEISGNSGNFGGAIRINRAVLLIDGCKITENTAKMDGGGIYALRTKVTMKSGSISNNSAKQAGGMNLGTECEVVLSGGSISGNRATKHGGGLLTSGTNPNVKLSGVSITGNTAGDRGGAILADKGVITMTAGVISGNTAKYGGAIRGAKSTVNIYGGVIKNNKAEDGGAFYTIETTMDIQNITISDNEAAISGGALAFGSNSRITMKNVTVENNKSSNYGGGILLQGTNPALTMTGCTVKNNTTGVYGGGVAVYRGSFIGKDLTITGNLANYGGGFYTGRATEVKLTNYNISGNTSNNDGAGLYLLRSPVTLDTGSITGNTALGNAGGMACGSETVVKVIGDTTISQNTATSGGGIMLQGTAPALYVGDGTHQVTITDNTVGGSGGAIRGGVNGEVFGILDLNNVLISGNRSNASEPNASGSAIYYSRRVRSNFENVTIENNHGAGNGGGIALQYMCEVALKNCQVTGNSSVGNGGGLYLGTLSKIDLDNTPVTGNTTVGRGGGAMIQSSGTLNMLNSTLKENVAATGGGVYVTQAGNLRAEASTIVNNTANRQTSAIYSEGSIYLTDVEISGNTDQAGGCAVYMDGAGGDGESYLPDVCQFKGKIIIADNTGGEMILTDEACISIYGTGLAEGSRILVDRPEGGITHVICGPYDYIREGDRYTITSGQRSLSEADPITAVEEPAEETTEAPTEQFVTVPGKSVNPLAILIAVGALLAAACAVVVVLIVKKNKK